MKIIQGIKFWVTGFDDIQSHFDDLEVLQDFVKEGISSEEELNVSYSQLIEMVEDLELRNMLSREEDKLNAVIQITAGAGGTESCDWASMLMRMDMMWAEKNNVKGKELNFQPGDVAGLQTGSLEIQANIHLDTSRGKWSA